ncbi:MAG: carbohydrate kinase family protein [Candidatus Thorarchaeota archaeon]
MIRVFDVICIGAALVDMVAQVDRFPENDDEVFVSKLNIFSGGAAANTAYACAKLGLKTSFIGKLGRNDIFGSKILNNFEEGRVHIDLLKYSEKHNTGSAYVVLNKEGERRIYAHSGAANYLSKEDIIENEISSTKILFLSSLKNTKPFIRAAEIGRKNYIPVVLNPGMLIIEEGFLNIRQLLEKIDVLIISQREFQTLFEFHEKRMSIDLTQDKAEKLHNLGIKVLVITLSKNGALLITKDSAEIIPSFKVNRVIDTTGAGDAFSAGFLYGFSKNLSFDFEDLKNNVKIGNFVASRIIEKLGARNGIPKPEEIDLDNLHI